MIELTISASGGQVASALEGDLEEMAYCLDTLADMDKRQIECVAKEIAEFADHEKIIAWLIGLAGAIEEAVE